MTLEEKFRKSQAELQKLKKLAEAYDKFGSLWNFESRRKHVEVMMKKNLLPESFLSIVE